MQEETSNSTPIEEETPVYQVPVDQVRQSLVQGMKSTGSTFYWIAGLSLINTIMMATKANLMFLGGLGITLVVDVVFANTGANIQPIGFGINITIALMFLALGMWAGKGAKPAFIIGMGLYALDACLYILVSDWINVAFHGYFLYLLFQGFKASGALKAALKKLDDEVAVAGSVEVANPQL